MSSILNLKLFFFLYQNSFTDRISRTKYWFEHGGRNKSDIFISARVSFVGRHQAFLASINTSHRGEASRGCNSGRPHRTTLRKGQPRRHQGRKKLATINIRSTILNLGEPNSQINIYSLIIPAMTSCGRLWPQVDCDPAANWRELALPATG